MSANTVITGAFCSLVSIEAAFCLEFFRLLKKNSDLLFTY